MNQPVKIIWKFKNSNRRIQYNVYVFVGDVSKNIISILQKIKNLNFYDTLINLTKDEYKTLENKYGDFWYNSFFNNYHISSNIYTIRESTIQKNELKDKFGNEWLEKHILQQQLMTSKLIYSYEALIKDILESKSKKKKEKSAELHEVHGFPTSQRAWNVLWDVKHQFPVYTKTSKSKSYYCAGYYVIKFNNGWVKSYCPKFITLNRYEFKGPFKTKAEMQEQLRLANGK